MALLLVTLFSQRKTYFTIVILKNRTSVRAVWGDTILTLTGSRFPLLGQVREFFDMRSNEMRYKGNKYYFNYLLLLVWWQWQCACDAPQCASLARLPAEALLMILSLLFIVSVPPSHMDMSDGLWSNNQTVWPSKE
jgi:hypothetical protein